MALEKQTVVDKMEVLEDGTIQVRTATRIVEDGEVISTSYHRHVLPPGADPTNEDPRVQAICMAVHKPAVVAAYAAKQAAQNNPN